MPRYTDAFLTDTMVQEALSTQTTSISERAGPTVEALQLTPNSDVSLVQRGAPVKCWTRTAEDRFESKPTTKVSLID